MGLLDGILGAALGSGPGSGPGQAGLVNGLLSLVNNPATGGLSGLVQKFEQAGLGGVASSWVSTGQNLPITAEQIQKVLGSGQVQAIAQKLGIDPAKASSAIAQVLPHVVDHLTPNGQIPDASALGPALSALRAKLGV